MRAGVIVAAVAATAALALPAAGALPSASAPGASTTTPAGMPDDLPPAALHPEPSLPAPAAWPGPEAFPRTSGTGRLDAGGFYWTDWIYDDHGAMGIPAVPGAPGGDPAEQGVPSFGTYTYPPGPAQANGADIFRAGVFLTRQATVWRVDWNTLVTATVPVAEWAFSTGAGSRTGSAWPAGAGVRSPGIDRALVVSSRGARLIDVASGAELARLLVTVDLAAKSFIVTVPRSVLPVAGTWTVRLAAGLANAAGDGFAPPGGGALPSQPAVYNVAFRGIGQESPADNFWDDDAQARALAAGDVSAFSAAVDWAALAARRTTPEAAPAGWSDRWYVSSISEGQGRRTDAAALADGKPAYFGTVQPYAVYVPTTYDGTKAVPLTFLLHSLTQNQNQYAATTPKFAQQACQARGSICVTTLGRGPSGFYANDAQLDFWEVWHDAASAYRLDPERTVLSGYSMGGIGTYALAEAHPDLFGRAVGLAGATAGNSRLLENLRWIPTYLAGGAADELVPVSDEVAMAQGLDALGYRYRWLLYPAEDHVAFELQDGFSDAATYMGTGARVTRPGRITFRWNDSANNPAYGYGVTGDYWLRNLAARSAGPDAVIDATSSADPDPAVTDVRTHSPDVPGDPTPAVVSQLAWATGPRPGARPLITLALANVGALSVDLAAAGIGPGQPYRVDVTSDGPVALTLGARTLHLAGGHTVLTGP